MLPRAARRLAGLHTRARFRGPQRRAVVVQQDHITASCLSNYQPECVPCLSDGAGDLLSLGQAWRRERRCLAAGLCSTLASSRSDRDRARLRLALALHVALKAVNVAHTYLGTFAVPRGRASGNGRLGHLALNSEIVTAAKLRARLSCRLESGAHWRCRSTRVSVHRWLDATYRTGCWFRAHAKSYTYVAELDRWRCPRGRALEPLAHMQFAAGCLPIADVRPRARPDGR